MAASPTELRAALIAGLLCCVLPAQAAAPRAEARAAATQDIVLDAKDSQIDYAANRLTFNDVTIGQGDLKIKADKAVADGTGLNFDDSHCQLSGNVQITFETGNLQANEANVRFSGNRIAQAQATGTPAQFEQKLASMPRPVRGHAGNIDFDILAQTIRLADDAWLFDGRNEMNSPALLYSIKEQIAKNETPPGTTGRVHMTIRPDGAVETQPAASHP
jgi:lipopolysaccharide transport protein LptA